MTNPDPGASVKGSLASSPVPGGEEVGRHAVPLDEILKKLTPAQQRLLRELAYNLALLHGLEGRAVPPEEEPTDLTEYVDIWVLNLLVHEGRSTRTAQTYRSCVGMLLRVYPCPSLDEVEAFLATRFPQVGPYTQSVSIFALKSFFSYLARKGIIAVNPAQYIKAPRTPRRERVIPSANHVARLLNAPTITNRDRAMIMLLAACGLRAAEMLSIGRSAVSLEKPRRVTVVGKGNKQRTVPMTEQTARALENHIRSLPSSSPWLFPGRDPARGLDQSVLNERFRTLCGDAGIPLVTPHQLRHYFASKLLNAEVSLIIVSQLLGHKNPSVTARVYWHLLDEAARVKAYEEHDPLQEINEEMARMVTGQLSFDFGEVGK